MAKFLIRSAKAFQEWKEVDLPSADSVEDMATRLQDPTEQSDLGFVGSFMEALFNPHGNFIVEVWASEFVSFQHGVLEVAIQWDYFHDRQFPERTEKFRIMEGEL